jgi:hypothetical protein
MTLRMAEPLAEEVRWGTPLAVEMEASCPQLMAGAPILPQRDALDRQAHMHGWRHSSSIRIFVALRREYRHEHIENDWGLVPGDGQWEVQRDTAHGLDALDTLLQSWTVAREDWTHLWKTAIPEWCSRLAQDHASSLDEPDPTPTHPWTYSGEGGRSTDKRLERAGL